jgi:hypothetical protein
LWGGYKIFTRRLRFLLIALFVALLPLSLIYQAYVRPPVSSFEGAPDGFDTSRTTDDLAGLLAAFDMSSYPMALNTTDYARIAAYAADAYYLTRYQSNNPEQASSAFLKVLTTLIPDPAYLARFPQMDNNRTGEAKVVLERASQDGYDKLPVEPSDFISPLDLGVDPKEFTWRTAAGIGNMLEQFWGTLRPSADYSCLVPPPPVNNLSELRTAVDEVLGNFDLLFGHPNPTQLRELVESWIRQRTSQPARAWLQLGSNTVVDAKLSRAEADALLHKLALVIHDTQILTWKYKYNYLLIGPEEISDSFPHLTPPLTPSYPSHYAAVASAAATVIEHYAPGARARLEIPGSLIAVPTTRIYTNVRNVQIEAETSARLIGLDYDFSSDAGRLLGQCVAKDLL